MAIDSKKKWLISVWAGLLFLVIASPLVYRVTGYITQLIGLRTSKNGCPNGIGLILHAIVFILLTRLSMIGGDKENYTGLAPPQNMLACNKSQLEAQNANCVECVRGAQICMGNPQSAECAQALANCNLGTCKNQQIVHSVHQNCARILA